MQNVSKKVGADPSPVAPARARNAQGGRAPGNVRRSPKEDIHGYDIFGDAIAKVSAGKKFVSEYTMSERGVSSGMPFEKRHVVSHEDARTRAAGALW